MAKSNAKKGQTKAQKEAAARKAAAEKKRKEREATAKKERDAAIKSGALIVNGDVEFHRNEREKSGKMLERAQGVLDMLRSSKTPITVHDVIEKQGGQFPQYLAMFRVLEAQELVTPYRVRGGDKAGQVAYLAN